MSSTNLTVTVNNEVMVFENEEFGKVRTVEIDGEPYFVGKDVAEILGYERSNKAVVDRVDDEDRILVDGKTQSQIGIQLGQRGGWLINEAGLYSLVLGSKLESAKKFKHWVTSEVLPSIHKTGSYSMNRSYEDELKLQLFNKDPLSVVRAHQALVQIAVDEAVEPLTQIIEEQKPKVEYCDTVLNKPNLIPISTIAKDLSLNAMKLNLILKENGIIYKGKSGTWQPYKDYEWLIKKGYADYRSYTFEKAKPQLQWTEKGRKWIISNIKKWKKQVKNNLK